MKKKMFLLLSALALMVTPFSLALAQVGTVGATTTCSGAVNNITDVICKVGNILNKIIPVVIVLGVLYFVWGVVSFVLAGDEEAKTAGRDRMIWGIIGLVVIVGMWGLVRIVANTFNLDNSTRIELPTVPFGLP